MNFYTSGGLQDYYGADKSNPTIEKGIELARQQNPNLGDVQPYGFFSRLMHGNDEAYTAPNRTVYINANHFANGYTPQDVATSLAHEGTHVQQARDRNLSPIDETIYQMTNAPLPYQQNPDEIGAYTADVARARAMHLSDPPIPDFVTGEMRPPRPAGGGFDPLIDTAPSMIKKPRPQPGISIAGLGR